MDIDWLTTGINVVSGAGFLAFGAWRGYKAGFRVGRSEVLGKLPSNPHACEHCGEFAIGRGVGWQCRCGRLAVYLP